MPRLACGAERRRVRDLPVHRRRRQGMHVHFQRSATGPVFRMRSCVASFESTEMFAVEMHECNLTGARFNKVDFSRALSRKQIETRASFHHCKMDLADLAETKLPRCSLSGSRLREADLSSADLTDADLTDGDPFQTNLYSATLTGADLTGAEVSGSEPADTRRFQGRAHHRRAGVPAARRHGRRGANAATMMPLSGPTFRAAERRAD